MGIRRLIRGIASTLHLGRRANGRCIDTRTLRRKLESAYREELGNAKLARPIRVEDDRSHIWR